MWFGRFPIRQHVVYDFALFLLVLFGKIGDELNWVVRLSITKGQYRFISHDISLRISIAVIFHIIFFTFYNWYRTISADFPKFTHDLQLWCHFSSGWRHLESVWILNLLCFKSTGCIFHCMNIKLTSDVGYDGKGFIHSPCSRWYSRRYRETYLHFWLVYLSTSLLGAFLFTSYLYSSSCLR